MSREKNIAFHGKNKHNTSVTSNKAANYHDISPNSGDGEMMSLRRHEQKQDRRGVKRRRRYRLSNELGVLLTDHEINHGLFLREARKQIHSVTMAFNFI